MVLAPLGGIMLRTTLSVGSRTDAVVFELTVANDADEDATLSFSDGQRTRFTVEPAGGGDAVWRSDAEKMFMQVLGDESIPAGESATFGEVWESPDPGEYRVVGEVTCTGETLEADAEFSV